MILGCLLTACSAQKRVWYVQDTENFTPEAVAEAGQIRIKPLDRLTIVVNSRNPELAVPFNSSTSYNSLTGNPVTAPPGSSRSRCGPWTRRAGSKCRSSARSNAAG